MFSEALWALLLLSSSFDKWLCCRAEREEGRRKITYKKRRMGCADSHIHLEGIRKRVLKSRTPSKKGRSARRAGNPGPERPKNPGPAPLPTPTPTPTPTLTPSVLLGGGGRGGWKKRITKQSIPRPVCPALATSLDLRIKGFQHFLQAPAQTRPARLSTFSAPNPNMLESPWPQDLVLVHSSFSPDPGRERPIPSRQSSSGRGARNFSVDRAEQRKAEQSAPTQP
uniref:Uncharacterized protein LOC110221486 isoform X2 n=1 Tax=Phascolarctos cinereus TaxID=38626 RepID=A0A6P5M0N9_PHACI|nr:uncharacterized protein LOC110221486 isoform X2 [Phascolarctos cinereus]